MSESVSPTSGRKRAFTMFTIVMVLVILGGGAWWLAWRNVESTDDAFIDGHISALAAQISGRVTQVLVADNQHVQAGELLIQLDDRDQKNALQYALAEQRITTSELAQHQAELEALQATLSKAKANLQLAKINFQHDSKEYSRYLRSGIAVSPSTIDNWAAQAKTSEATLLASEQEVSYTAAMLKKQISVIAVSQTTLQKNETAIEAARLQLSYTRITAPVSGYIAKRTAEKGNVVASGSTLLHLVSDQLWVTANFKETQLKTMQPGQPVQIQIDAWPNKKFPAKVDSMQRATGSVFSLLPSENATGNYVKIVQRVPVKIVFTDKEQFNYPLAPGMSVVPYVDVSR